MSRSLLKRCIILLPCSLSLLFLQISVNIFLDALRAHNSPAHIITHAELNMLLPPNSSLSSSREIDAAAAQGSTVPAGAVGGNAEEKELGAKSKLKRKVPRFAMVTPTYEGHFKLNMMYLLTLIENCDDCYRVPTIFVCSSNGEADALQEKLRSSELKNGLDIKRGNPGRDWAYNFRTPDETLDTRLKVIILSVSVCVKEMGLDPVALMIEFNRNLQKKWKGKFTVQSIKKYIGAWAAFKYLKSEVIWWVDSEAYLWRRDFSMVRWLNDYWDKGPNMFWTRDTRWGNTVDRCSICLANGTMKDMHKSLEDRGRRHLFEYPFYLVGKEVFDIWTNYIEGLWGGRKFIYVFLDKGFAASGRIMHFIESNLMVFIEACKTTQFSPSCSRYNVLEVDGIFVKEMGKEKADSYFAYSGKQGHFEHMFRFLSNSTYSKELIKIANKYRVIAFRLDDHYVSCSMAKALFDSIVDGKLENLAMQINSDASKIFRCIRSLPVECMQSRLTIDFMRGRKIKHRNISVCSLAGNSGNIVRKN